MADRKRVKLTDTSVTQLDPKWVAEQMKASLEEAERIKREIAEEDARRNDGE